MSLFIRIIPWKFDSEASTSKANPAALWRLHSVPWRVEVTRPTYGIIEKMNMMIALLDSNLLSD